MTRIQGHPTVAIAGSLIMLLASIFGWSASADGQDTARSQIGNLPTNTQVVPKLAARELGAMRRPEREPVSEFLESVSGGDATIECFVGQSRILSVNARIANEQGVGVIATSDPSVIDFDVLPNPQLIRVVGKRVGVSDLTLITPEGKAITFDIHVVYDLPLVEAQMRALFPDVNFRLSQLREHVVIEGQASSPSKIARVIETLTVFLTSMQVERKVKETPVNEDDLPVPRATGRPEGPAADGEPGSDDESDPGVAFDPGTRPSVQSEFFRPRIINLMRVPGPQQVLLKVTIAELNRRALRQLGSDLTIAPDLTNFIRSIQTQSGNLTGVFGDGDFRFLMNALRQNSVATVLAEPNLVTMSGHTSRFQSGGEFAVPVPQGGGAGLANVTVEFKPFGVQLAFTPTIEEDGSIRLTVEPEVSNIDDSLSVSIVPGADPVPGLRTRNASTTVQMREGQTLAIAGLLNNESDATTRRVPLLGDIPYLGTLFTNNSAESQEEELLIVITPHLVSPLDGEDASCLPGQDVMEPNDYEFYLLNRIEGRTGVSHRATTNWDDPLGLIRKQQFERRHGRGPIGFSR